MNAERDEIRSLANSLAENANGHVDDKSFNHLGLLSTALPWSYILLLALWQTSCIIGDCKDG